MTDEDDLRADLNFATQPGAYGNLIARGQARALVWTAGVLPDGAPQFSRALTYDLQAHGFDLAASAAALLLADDGSDQDLSLIRESFERAAEALEASQRNGDPAALDRATNTAITAICYHLAGFAVRAYSTISNNPIDSDDDPAAYALAQLLLRRLDVLAGFVDSTIPPLIERLDRTTGPIVPDDQAPDPRFDALIFPICRHSAVH